VSEDRESRIDIKRSDGEVLPPVGEESVSGRMFWSTGRGTVKVVRLGPLGALGVMLSIGLLLALGFMFLGGLLMLLLPLALIGGAGAYLANRFGVFNRLPR